MQAIPARPAPSPANGGPSPGRCPLDRQPIDAPLLLISLLACGLILALSWPFLIRSLADDEVMLFTNFPMNPWRALVEPLPYFDQAGTPIHSAFWALFGGLPPLPLRLLSSALLILPALVLIAVALPRCGRWPALAYAAAALLCFPYGLRMLSELKHYGLEVLACLLVLVWLMAKPAAALVGPRDALLLGPALVAGLSTIPLVPVALGLHLAGRGLAGGPPPRRRELPWLAALVLLVLAHYALARHVIHIQMANYPDAYLYAGFGTGLGRFLGALASLVAPSPVQLVALVGLPLVVVGLDARCSGPSRRLLLLALAVLLVYGLLAGLGLYPADKQRHVIWMTAFLWMALASSLAILQGWIGRGRLGRALAGPRRAALLPLALALLLALPPLRHLWRTYPQDQSLTHNNAAIQHLAALPPSRLVFWIGGDRAFHYYRRFRPDLARHRVDPWTPPASVVRHFDDPRRWQRDALPMLEPARQALAAAPAGEPFVLFASHFEREGGRFPNRAAGLAQALAERDCTTTVRDFRDVHVYQARCRLPSPLDGRRPDPR
ncbi:MAG: hypothetical protein VKM01_07525 [Cyanobacteriota bacterium]|nr:hypothetical protein [Cyanobacteriota bacterium]